MAYLAEIIKNSDDYLRSTMKDSIDYLKKYEHLIAMHLHYKQLDLPLADIKLYHDLIMKV